jgi:hypothetical protein
MIFTFAGTIAQFIDDDWQLIERLVDFYHIQDKEHEGQWAGKAFVTSATERGSADKICRISPRCTRHSPGAFDTF